jgi:NAD(P)-dependent dehydrogenase (short-subunit alcohol dehydrogenase family)
MSSLGGRFGYPNRSAYCTAKMGLIGFGKTLPRELGPHNIRVNAIAPGAVAGDRIERVLQGRADAEHETLEEERASRSGQTSTTTGLQARRDGSRYEDLGWRLRG